MSNNEYAGIMNGQESHLKLRNAYREIALANHPEKDHENPEEAAVIFDAVRRVFEMYNAELANIVEMGAERTRCEVVLGEGNIDVYYAFFKQIQFGKNAILLMEHIGKFYDGEKILNLLQYLHGKCNEQNDEKIITQLERSICRAIEQKRNQSEIATANTIIRFNEALSV